MCETPECGLNAAAAVATAAAIKQLLNRWRRESGEKLKHKNP